jgi:hypothetical protein
VSAFRQGRVPGESGRRPREGGSASRRVPKQGVYLQRCQTGGRDGGFDNVRPSAEKDKSVGAAAVTPDVSAR